MKALVGFAEGMIRVPSSRSSASPRAKHADAARATSRRRAPKNGSPARNIKVKRSQFDDLVGGGADLWNDDEFERFQAWLRENRRRGE